MSCMTNVSGYLKWELPTFFPQFLDFLLMFHFIAVSYDRYTKVTIQDAQVIYHYIFTAFHVCLKFQNFIILKVYAEVYFRGRVPNFNQSGTRMHCFLAFDWLKFETLPTKPFSIERYIMGKKRVLRNAIKQIFVAMKGNIFVYAFSGRSKRRHLA